MVVRRCTEVRVEFELTIYEGHAFVLEFLAIAYFAGVGTTTLIVIGRWRGRRPLAIGWNKVTGTKLAGNFIETNLDGVFVELFGGNVSTDGGWDGDFVGSIAPS